MSANRGQIFSLDLIVSLFILIMMLLAAVWLWDTAQQKLYLAESRDQLELSMRNAMNSLLQTVGDPPAWNILSVINSTTVKALGIGKNRPWFIDENKTRRLAELNATDYDLIKDILTVRGNELFLNVSKYNETSGTFVPIGIIGRSPNSSAEQVIRIDRYGLSDQDDSWVRITIEVWKTCVGPYC